LWRIYGPEYAAAPYLPAEMFKEYVNRYDEKMIQLIHKNNGYARIHSHGNLMGVIDHIISMGTDAIDPIEPPRQGDAELKYIRKKYGKQLVLFGNLEISDIENMATPRFRDKVNRALEEGTYGKGRGFVLMPSACPYGRKLPLLTMMNYEAIIECIEKI
jgi:uroporphyrinogen-III decarboxylase